jgi:hypothetical protein
MHGVSLYLLPLHAREATRLVSCLPLKLLVYEALRHDMLEHVEATRLALVLLFSPADSIFWAFQKKMFGLLIPQPRVLRPHTLVA